MTLSVSHSPTTNDVFHWGQNGRMTVGKTLPNKSKDPLSRHLHSIYVPSLSIIIGALKSLSVVRTKLSGTLHNETVGHGQGRISTYPKCRDIWQVYNSALRKHVTNGFPRARQRVRLHDINVCVRIEPEIDPVGGPPNQSWIVREALSEATLWFGIASDTNLLCVNTLRSIE